MALNSENNSVTNELNKKMTITVSINKNTSKNWVINVKSLEIELNTYKNMELMATESLTDKVLMYRGYSENGNSLTHNDNKPHSYSHLHFSNTSDSVLTNESQNLFKRFPWKSIFVTTIKYIKKWPMKKYLKAFKSKIQMFIAEKRNTSKSSNEPIDCTNEFIYICSESKSISNNLLLDRS